MKKLYGFKLPSDWHLVELGGGCGELSFELCTTRHHVCAFIEPDPFKFCLAEQRLASLTNCYNTKIGDPELIEIIIGCGNVVLIMQDVLEHVPFETLKEFFEGLRASGATFSLLGRTPNLKSPFGLRNSFGDNTHLHRFTDLSLKQFLHSLGFTNIAIHAEPYKVTGITSLIRSIPYLLILYAVSISYAIIFGTREGWLTPNLVFFAD